MIEGWYEGGAIKQTTWHAVAYQVVKRSDLRQ
jgi:hypothetical protein